MKNPLPYIRFRRKATNRHGVHSPFIYKLLEDVVYKKKQNKSTSKKRKKEYQLFLRLFKYYNSQNVLILNPNDFFEKLFSEYKIINPDFKIEQKPSSLKDHPSFDVYILNNIQNQDIINDFIHLAKIKNDSFVIIPQIRASKQQLEFWKRFTEKDFARVSLEFYHFGLVFFRKECSREYFKVRF